MLNTVVLSAILIISAATIGLIYRVIKGPTTPDRVVALDAIGINLVAIVALISIALNTSAFVEVILLIGILAFIGTVAFSKYLEKGVIIENERDR
ncbi:Na(+)/H(+) antiporter subunit F1 [Cytobacillus firmus]|uniref:Multisubunit Na+/H+ antiporter subunit F n=1 Tax=Cytobacillus firmus DS1 TaxID=1307436 RepID=W7L2Q4_CYTFI|nr:MULTISPECIES: Na(+)/H(+) antiporter subunit F1 [Bacillaceae]EWG09432.1 multisubunit Na+/H+ antiporter subunit F [Cytobacillus firmus DS1]MBG9452440.1 monovalent cation/H+ antiporter subunit F [Cytobacillus firmus]MBG9545223.1 monovalent cation/H+ antiporter subunit F [Cytobacillus firmus]MBG9545889.1 monovalent cation/H+ antiporter subunit F [Cytobacillus firmus]MBG9554700.1 monovalent cation/H+ antiporter subunit F [Cytobacillus firmus]